MPDSAETPAIQGALVCRDLGTTSQSHAPTRAPNQRRHAVATAVRKRYGLEAAGATLGHDQLSTTEIYAEKNLDLAAKIAFEVG